MRRWRFSRTGILSGLVLAVLVLGAVAAPGAPHASVATPVLTPLGPGFSGQAHVDTPSSELYVAETLTSALWRIDAVEERFLGRPFWLEPLTGKGTRVAVIDTGIDPDHPDLEGSVVAWRDFLFQRSDPYDDDTHGTHVAGIIAAHGHFQYRPDRHYFPFGARGVAPGVDLLVAKAMDGNGDGDARHVANAILWALDPNGDGDYSDGAHVINLSIGLEVPPTRDEDGTLAPPITLPGFRADSGPEARVVREAILKAVRAGAVVVVAAGNHEPGAADSTVTFPGTMREVITVGAVDSDGNVAPFSNRGTSGSMKPEIVAPGILLSTFPTERDLEDSQRDGYVALGGTSMAAPLVAGTVALMMEGDPSLRRLSATEDLSWHTTVVRNALIETSDGTGYTTAGGYGVLQVDAAVAEMGRGDGDLNWDALGLLTLLVLLVTGVILLRRRRRRQAEEIRRAKAEARARLDARPPPRDDEADIPVVFERSDSGDRPHWQAPPWDREPAERREG